MSDADHAWEDGERVPSVPFPFPDDPRLTRAAIDREINTALTAKWALDYVLGGKTEHARRMREAGALATLGWPMRDKTLIASRQGLHRAKKRAAAAREKWMEAMERQHAQG
jgi:hypothetical protein